MARILIEGRWYDALASDALYETEYESLVLQAGSQLFPNFYVIPFKADVESETGVHRPDFALIEHDYRSWWVVEVELSHHSLGGHVLPQVLGFLRGRYTAAHARYIAQRSGGQLDEDRLYDMIRGASPGVYVMADRLKDDWVRTLRPLGCLLGVVEVFRSDRNEHVLRVNGEAPSSSAPGFIPCHRHQILPRTLVVDAPGPLLDLDANEFVIEYQGSASVWQRVNTQDAVMLRPLQGDPLRGMREVLLRVDTSGRLVFQSP